MNYELKIMWCEPHNTLLQIRLLTHVDWVVIYMRLQAYLHAKIIVHKKVSQTFGG